MLSLKQIQWFLVKNSNLSCCVFNVPLHNLKKSLYGKLLFYNSFITVMRTRLFVKAKKRSSKRLKLQMMASPINSKCNKPILKTESSSGAQVKHGSSNTASNRLSSSCGKEENNRSGSKESIKSGNDSNNDKKQKPKNPSKRVSETYTSFVSTMHQQVSIQSSSQTVVNGHLNWRHPNRMWPHSYDALVSQSQNIPSIVNPVVFRSFSDSRIQQQRLNLIYLNKDDSANTHYNRNRMRRSNTLDSSNRTNTVERDKQLAWTLRSWQRTPYGKKISKQKITPLSCRFKVMSYNVLAQQLLTEHSFLYRNHNARALLWEQRWSNLLEEIRQQDADFLCLQEVQESHLESYFNELKKLGYDGLFKQRTGVRTDGCAIYYKSSMFNLVEYTTVEFNQSEIHVLNRDNVAIIAKFSPKQNPTNEFVIATTHLLYNPKREDVRLAQTQVLLSEIDRMSYKKNNLMKHLHLPIIITGDFNLTPSSAVYELITQGILQYEHLTNRSLARTNTTFANITGKSLLPSSLRITDECQHADLMERRKENSVLSREEELKLVQLHHSERLLNSKCSKKFNKFLFSTGTLSHHLALKSAYEHRHGEDVEATTFQDKWVTVDYIFYSGVKDENDLIREDKLKLLSRYTIPTRQELQGIRIPNFAYGSDHLSLVVKFQLDP